jgi:hypothetical protein
MNLLRVVLPAAILVVAGCGTVDALDVGGGPEPNLVLYVSNQSFADDPVGIRVELAGQVVVDSLFRVESQHTWVEHRLTVPAGTHQIEVTSTTGVVSTHDLVVPRSETRWVVIEYWYYPGDTARSFTFHVSDQPVAFA